MMALRSVARLCSRHSAGLSTGRPAASPTATVVQNSLFTNKVTNKDLSFRYLFQLGFLDLNSFSFPIVLNQDQATKKPFSLTTTANATVSNYNHSVRYLFENDATENSMESFKTKLRTIFGELEPPTEAIQFVNRNARAPKKANHGRRPCSHVMRRRKRLRRHKGW